jgi:hypothetical protein
MGVVMYKIHSGGQFKQWASTVHFDPTATWGTPGQVLCPAALQQYSTCANEQGQYFGANALQALDSSHVLACNSYQSDIHWKGRLHCFTLTIAGGEIANAATAADNGKLITNKITGHYAHFSFSRAKQSNTFLACWQLGFDDSGLACTLFDVNGALMVNNVGGVSKVTEWGATQAQYPATAALTETSGVVCSCKSHVGFETTCIFMSWTSGDVNSLVYDSNQLWPAISLKTTYKMVTRLTDTKALFCFISRGANTYDSWDGGNNECAFLDASTKNITIATDTRASNNLNGEGWPWGNAAKNVASDFKILAVSENKAVMTYATRRRNHKYYTMEMDLDTQANTVTNGSNVEIPASPLAYWYWPAQLTQDKLFVGWNDFGAKLHVTSIL